MRLLIYSPANGEIIRVVSCPELLADMQHSTGEGFIVSEDVMVSDVGYYIHSGEAVKRPDMPCVLSKASVLANGIDFITINNVPTGADVFSAGVLLGVADGADVEIDFDLTGEYKVEVKLFPYIDWEVTIYAI